MHPAAKLVTHKQVITEDMVVAWLLEAELEERRTHVLYDELYPFDPVNVLESEFAEKFDTLNHRLGTLI